MNTFATVEDTPFFLNAAFFDAGLRANNPDYDADGENPISDVLYTVRLTFSSGTVAVDYSRLSDIGNAQIIDLNATGRFLFIGTAFDLGFLSDSFLVSYVPQNNLAGVNAATIELFTRRNTTTLDTQSFGIDITGVNDAPVVQTMIPDATGVENTLFTLAIPPGSFTDAEGALTYAASNVPPWLSFDAATQAFTGTPPDGSAGAYIILVTATDSDGLTTEDDFTIEIANIEPFTSGDDVRVNQPGNDGEIDGLSGFDTLDLAGFTTPIRLEVVAANSDRLTTIDGIENISNIESYIFGSGNDTAILLNVGYGGLGGARTVAGGAGDDSYFVDGDDTIIELAGEGTDTVITGELDYVLPDHIEVLEYRANPGAPASVTITGNAQNNVITGDAPDMTINGGGGNDRLTLTGAGGTLNGGAGEDVLDAGTTATGFVALNGGNQSDELYVRAGTNAVTVSGGGGYDFLFTERDLGILPDDIEELVYIGTGNATLSGNSRDNQITGGIGNDTITGGGGDDNLFGEGGNDILDGGPGDDFLGGGQGDDIFIIRAGTNPTINGGPGRNAVRTERTTETIANDITDLVFIGTGDATLAGNVLSNTVTGGAGNDTITGGPDGIDTLNGGGGNDTLTVTGQGGTLDGGAGNDTLDSGATSVRDVLLLGGDGDDTLFIRVGTNSVGIAGGDGNDTLRIARDLGIIPLDIENLIYIGTGNATLIGSAGDNVITGGSGDDDIDGSGGNDLLIGGAGSDTFDGGTGIDTLDMSAFTGPITLNTDTATITSADGVERVVNVEAFALGSGNDVARLGGGAFSVGGGPGDDSYFDNDGNDTLFENANGGTDIVFAGTSYSLAEHIENLTYTGTGPATLTGNAGNNRIEGGAGDDVIDGGEGDDLLIAGAGNDDVRGGLGRDLIGGRDGNDTLRGGTGIANELVGGDGDDIFIVEAMGDSVVEFLNGGIDEIQTALTVMVNRLHVETLRFTDGTPHLGVGNAHDETIIGNTGRDDLFGRGGNDTLRGGTGAANALFGQEGDDSYFVDAVGDSTIEAANEGTDTVFTTLGVHTLRVHVENLAFTGTGNFTGIGNASGNVMSGKDGNDFLSGLDGDDVLTGGLGLDLLIGGAGADTFRINNAADRDRILDFVSGTDRIALDGAVFTRTATIDYVAGSVATSTNSTFLYVSGNGVLSYDADGTGAGAPVAIANLGGGLTLTVSDFLFY